MNKFTLHRQKKVDQKIEKDLEGIKKIILKVDRNTISLILVGGFGRGEGSIILKNKKILNVNDYDIVIITKKALPRGEIKKMAKRITVMLSIRLVDLIQYRESDLSSLPLTIFNYDLKHASYVFFGNKKVLELVPEYKSKLIPLSEGKNLLINRLICLTECFSEKFNKKKLTEKQTMFLVNQCAKAMLAVSDSLLLLRNKYHPSYEMRAKLFKKDYGKMKKLNHLVSEATKFKIFPQASPKVDNPEKYWLERKETFLSNFLKFMSFYYKKKFLTIDEFIAYYLKIKKPKLIEKLAETLGVSARPSKFLRAKIDCAQLLILSAYEKNLIKQNYVNKAQKLLDPCLDKSNKPLSWEELRKENGELWYKFFH